MNTAKVAAAILGVGIAAAGITFYASQDEELPPAGSTTSTTPAQDSSSPMSVNAIPESSRGIAKTGSNTDGSNNSSAVSETAPEGIDQATWDRARSQAKMIYGMSQQFRNSGIMQQMMDARIKSDTEDIAKQLGLEGEASEKIETMLKDRMDGTMERATKIWDAMLSDESRLTEMMALQDMKERNGELSPDLAAKQDKLRQETFGQFSDKEGPLTDEDVQKMFGSQRPENWYKDDAFLVKAAGELPETEGSALMDYAGKLDYLDREQSANRKVNSIQRNTDLTDQQSQQLKQLYIDTPDPSDEQLKAIIPADKLEAVKGANGSRRWGGWR